MIRSDFVEIRDFSSVVQAADVRVLRENPRSGATCDFVGGYLGFDDRARHATETLLRSLASQNGGAFFLNGVFGSGKSHLLGVVALLCDGAATDVFAALHPHLRDFLRAFKPRFVLHFSLDDYAAARFSLEEIFWREVAREAESRGFSPAEIALPNDGSRGETFAAWEEILARRGFCGAVICLDELSLFLSGREHRALQGDAAFLQFLAQRARRSHSKNEESSTRCALWIVAALQKTVEEIGDLDAYALAQIRDRFVTLPLSLAHLPSLIERRLVCVEDVDALAKFCDTTFVETTRALPHLDFGREEWRASYPFHPTTIALLEAISARFGSRTRSAVLFCQSISTDFPAEYRVLADELFDFWSSEMTTFPDLKPLAEVWRVWPETEAEIARDANEAKAMRVLMKTAILFAVAGRAPSVAALTNALLLDAQLPDDGNYQYAQILLEKMRAGGAGLSLERRDGIFADRYTIDGDARAGELARRFTFNALHTLPAGDRRIAQYVLRCCRDEILPLASFPSARNVETMWLHTPRTLRLELADEAPTPEILANRLAALADENANVEHEFLLFIVPPLTNADETNALSSTRFAANADSQALQAAWREAFAAALQLLQTRDARTDWTRWRNAVAWWLPRAATHSEWEMAREATAQQQLLNDVQLLDNARGLAVLDHLRAGLRARENALSRLGTCLLREGSFANGGGAHVEAGELALGENWASALETIAAWSLPEVFPFFARVAPRLRVLTPSSADALCLEILRRPFDAPFFAASLERTVRGVAQTLGIAIEQAGRWRIVSPTNCADSNAASSTRSLELASAMLLFLREKPPRENSAVENETRNDTQHNPISTVISGATHSGATLAALEAHFARSVWGLSALQTRIVLCALLRGGEISAFDARGLLLVANEIGLPLSRSVQTLREGRVLDSASWAKLSEIVAILSGENLGAVSFAEQERARSILRGWHDETTASTELAQARLHQWQRHLGQSENWARAAALDEMAQLLARLPLDSRLEALAQIVTFSPEATRENLNSWRETVDFLEQFHAPLLSSYAFLTHRELAPPPEMQTARTGLLARFENAFDDKTLLDDAARWRNEYSKCYAAWHNAQHAPPRFAAFRRLAQSEEMRVLLRLSALSTRDFTFATELQDALQHEISKACRHNGTLAHEPVCSSCRLVLEQRLRLRDPRELETMAHNGLEKFRAALRDETVKNFLAQHENGRALLHWRDADVTSDADVNPDATTLAFAETNREVGKNDDANCSAAARLWPLLSADGFRVLEEAFRPRRLVSRSWAQLAEQTRDCRTKKQWRETFLVWLDGEENLNDADEIRLQETV